VSTGKNIHFPNQCNTLPTLKSVILLFRCFILVRLQTWCYLRTRKKQFKENFKLSQNPCNNKDSNCTVSIWSRYSWHLRWRSSKKKVKWNRKIIFSFVLHEYEKWCRNFNEEYTFRIFGNRHWKKCLDLQSRK